MKIVALLLAVVLLLAPVAATPAKAEGAGNETLGILAGVCILFAVVAWQMDFGDDDIGQFEVGGDEDLQLVLCDTPRDAESSDADLGAALAMSKKW